MTGPRRVVTPPVFTVFGLWWTVATMTLLLVGEHGEVAWLTWWSCPLLAFMFAFVVGWASDRKWSRKR